MNHVSKPMVGTKRHGFEIIKDVLEVVSRRPPVRKTHLMYRANLSHVMMAEIVEKLIANDCIVQGQYRGKKGEGLSLTLKGAEVLKACKDFEIQYAALMKR